MELGMVMVSDLVTRAAHSVTCESGKNATLLHGTHRPGDCVCNARRLYLNLILNICGIQRNTLVSCRHLPSECGFIRVCVGIEQSYKHIVQTHYLHERINEEAFLYDIYTYIVFQNQNTSLFLQIHVSREGSRSSKSHKEI